MKNKNIIIIIVLLIIVASGAFYGGMKYQQSRRTSNFQGQLPAGQRNGANAQNRFRNGGATTGEIISQDDKSITVKMQDSSSKIVILTDNTTYNKTAEGSKSDLKVGVNVGVFGTGNSDGSITAQNIQLNPMFRGNNGSPTPTP